MPQAALNGENILVTLAIVLIALEALNVISKGIDAWKKITGRDARAAEMTALKERVLNVETWQKTVETRLGQGDKKFDENSRDTTEILIVLHTMIKHMQTGNDHQRLQETDDKLYKYLVQKHGVSPSALS